MNMKKITLISFLLLLGIAVPISAKHAARNAGATALLIKAKSTVDFRAYNSTSSTAWVYLYNTVTQQGEYYSVPANTGVNGVVIGQIDQNNDDYTATVQIEDNVNRNIRVYHAQEFNTTSLYATNLAIGCGACAEIIID
jgi:hypothetical protein